MAKILGNHSGLSMVEAIMSAAIVGIGVYFISLFTSLQQKQFTMSAQNEEIMQISQEFQINVEQATQMLLIGNGTTTQGMFNAKGQSAGSFNVVCNANSGGGSPYQFSQTVGSQGQLNESNLDQCLSFLPNSLLYLTPVVSSDPNPYASTEALYSQFQDCSTPTVMGGANTNLATMDRLFFCLYIDNPSQYSNYPWVFQNHVFASRQPAFAKVVFLLNYLIPTLPELGTAFTPGSLTFQYVIDYYNGISGTTNNAPQPSPLPTGSLNYRNITTINNTSVNYPYPTLPLVLSVFYTIYWKENTQPPIYPQYSGQFALALTP
jgi:hypothetical protein